MEFMTSRKWLKINLIFRAFRIFTNLGIQIKIIRILLRHEVRPVIIVSPMTFFNNFRTYLSDNFSFRKSSEILYCHYYFLVKKLSANFFYLISNSEILLWQATVGIHCYTITLKLTPMDHSTEGELWLSLKMDNQNIFFVSFTISSGKIFSVDSSFLIFIGCMQSGNNINLVRLASRDLGHILPATMLLTSVEALAMELGIDKILSINAINQLSANKNKLETNFVKTYDDFLISMGCHQLESGLFLLSVPLPVKPINEIRSKNRSHAVRKRQLKDIIRQEVAQNFRFYLH